MAELRDICANLHNSIQHSFNLMIATQKATVIGVMRANRDAAVDAELDSEGQGLNISMSKARRLIWGEAGNDKE